MIERIMFENFRGLKRLELTDLKPITLISGKNNAGKSSILEGIFLVLDHVAPESFTKINRFRGLVSSGDSSTLWETSFYQMDMQNSLRISVTYAGAQALLEYERDDTFVPPEEGHFIVCPMCIVRNMTTSASPNTGPTMPFTQFINAPIINGNSDSFIAEWIGKLELAGKKQHIIEIMKFIEPQINDLTTIVVNGSAQVFAKIGVQLLPLRLAGDGLNKLLFIVLSIAVNPRSIVLIDEIETGFHYSMYPQLWNTIAQTAYENACQIIATTHSYECIVGAVDGVERAGRSSAFCYYRLDRNDVGNQVYRYSDDLLQAAVATDMEVR